MPGAADYGCNPGSSQVGPVRWHAHRRAHGGWVRSVQCFSWYMLPAETATGGGYARGGGYLHSITGGRITDDEFCVLPTAPTSPMWPGQRDVERLRRLSLD